MTFSLWPRAVIATLLTLACIAVANAEPTLVSVQLECGKSKDGKNSPYRDKFNGVADRASLSILFEESLNGKKVVTSLSGYSTKGKIIIRGKGKDLTKNNDWDYLFSVKSQKSVIDALKDGIKGKEEPNKNWERKCSLKLISEKPIGQIRGDLAQYSAAKREIKNLEKKLAAERKKNLEQKNQVGANSATGLQTPAASATQNGDTASANVSDENSAPQSPVQRLGDIRSNFVGAGNQTAVANQSQQSTDLRKNYVGNQASAQSRGTGNTVSQNQKADPAIENMGKIAGALLGQEDANAIVGELNQALNSLQTGQANTQPQSQASDQTNAAPVANVTATVTQPIAVTSEDDIEVFLSTKAYKFIQKLDGSVKFAGANLPDERLGAYCAFWLFGEKKWHEAGAEKINIQAIWPSAREIFLALGISEPKQKNLVPSDNCNFESYEGPSVLFAQKRAGSFVLQTYYGVESSETKNEFAKGWLKIGEIPAGKISQSIASYEQKKQQQQQFYQQLVKSGEPTHISSALVRLPQGTDVTFCGYSRSNELTKAMEYLPEVAPLEELVHEQFARLINSQFIAGRYYRSMLFFESNEAFFEAWQMPDNRCHVYAAHPQDLELVLNAAKKLQPDFEFLISPLWSVEEVYNRQALKEGFETVEQLYLKEELGASAETVLELVAHGMSNVDRYNFIKEELLLSGYSEKADPNKVLEFLDDRKEARSLGISMAELKKKQEKEKAKEEERRRIAAAEARKKEKQEQELARQRAAAKVASGDGYFGNNALMSDSDCSQSFMTCVNQADFLKICKKGKYAGWANKFGLNPIRLAIGLSDREEPVDELFNSAGSSVVRTIAFGVVGDDCIWEFSISGTHKGNTIYRNYRCPVHSLLREGKELYPWTVVGDASWLGKKFKGQCTTSR